MPEPAWDDIRHFTVLARTLNLGRAAEATRSSPVTVMRRVRALETALSVKLFERRPDGHRLTGAGAAFLAHAQVAAEAIDEAARAVAGHDQRTGGQFRIVTTELVANWILLPRVAALRRAAPDLRLQIDAAPATVPLDDDGQTIAVRFRRPAAGPLRIRRLGTLPFGAFRTAGAAPGYIGWTGAFETIGLSRWLRDSFGAEPNLALTTMDGQLRAARAGLGTAGLPLFMARADPSLLRVATSAPFALEAWLVIPQAIAATARMRWVVQFVEAAFAALAH